MKKKLELSVFFPAYNEEKNITSTVVEAVKVLKKIAGRWEVIVIDDGSWDDTADKVKKLIKKDKRIRLIVHQKNLGYGAAIKTGMYNSRYPLICYTDSDGQFRFKEINKFLAKINKADLVVGYRLKRADRFYRRILANILRIVNIILFNLRLKDVDCGFKLFKKQVIDKIGKLSTTSSITETEFILKAKRSGFKIIEVGVHHYSRLEGEQTGAKILVILKSAIEGLRLWWNLIYEKYS